jgi:hypothetical protein
MNRHHVCSHSASKVHSLALNFVTVAPQVNNSIRRDTVGLAKINATFAKKTDVGAPIAVGISARHFDNAALVIVPDAKDILAIFGKTANKNSQCQHCC